MPNIVLLLADDLGYGDLGIYGHPTSNTPNIDKLAETSLDLRSFYVASPVCSPSRSAILTGNYPVTTGIWPAVFNADSLGGLDPEKFPTLASRLLKLGYKTGHVGKWHLGVGKNQDYLPTNHGFQDYLGIPYSHDMCPCVHCFANQTCFDDCRTDVVGCPLFLNEDIIEQPTDLVNLTSKYNRAALKFIEENKNDAFFLYYAFHQTHHPQFASKCSKSLLNSSLYFLWLLCIL